MSKYSKIEDCQLYSICYPHSTMATNVLMWRVKWPTYANIDPQVAT